MVIYEHTFASTPARAQTCEQPVPRHCVAQMSRRCHRIAVEILSGTGTIHVVQKSYFWSEGSLFGFDTYKSII